MASEELKVKVSADVAGAVSGLKQVEKELDKTGIEAQQASKNFNTFNASAAKIPSSVGGAASALGKAGGAAQKSGKDFTGLSRVIQDLPFGFVAISNNLTQLLPAAGAAGLAFSAIVAGITFASTGLQNWTRGLSGSKDNTEANSEALIRMQQELESVTDKMEGFTSALDYANKVGKLRLDIQFGKGLSTNLTDLRAQSIGLRDLIENLKGVRDQALGIQSASLDQLLPKLDPKEFDAFTKGILDPEVLDEATKKIFDAYKKAGEKVKEVNTELTKANQETGVIYAQIEQTKIDIVEEGVKKRDALDKKQEAADKKRQAALKQQLEDYYKYFAEYRRSFDRVLGDVVFEAELEFRLKEKEDTVKEKLLKMSLPKNVKPINLNIPFKLNPEIYKAAELSADLRENLQNIIANAIPTGLSNLGESIGAAIAAGENPIKAAGESIINSISDLITQMGKALIQYGIAKSGLDKILIGGIIIPGGVAIAAGVAAVAAAALLKNSFKPKAFAAGGLVFGPTMGLVGEGSGTSRSNPEVIAPLDKLKDYIGGGASSNVNVSGELVFRGDRFRAALVQSQRKGGLFI